MWPFYGFVMAHIVTGAIGLAAFWVPVVGVKGGGNHRYWGRVFTYMMVATGTIAIAISTCTLLNPIETHPHIEASPELIRGIFGWMMLYLAILTISLAWHGWLVVLNRRNHEANKEWRNITLQILVIVAALNCAWRGIELNQVLMMGISAIGLASGATNLFFLYRTSRGPKSYMFEHIKALVGAGISVYTAFLAFGAVRLMPEMALSPILWAIPLVTGLSIIFYQWWKVSTGRQPVAPEVRAFRHEAKERAETLPGLNEWQETKPL